MINVLLSLFPTGLIIRWVLIAAAAVALAGGSYVKGRVDCAALSHEKQLRTEVESLQSQLRNFNEVIEVARAREQDAQDKATAANARLSEYEEKLSKVPVPKSCGLSRDDVERLRNLANGK